MDAQRMRTSRQQLIEESATLADRTANGAGADAEPARELALEEAARNLIANRFDSYKAQNGKLCSIEGDDGEKCWIISFDDMAELEAALPSAPASEGAV